MTNLVTYKFRVKDSSQKSWLEEKARAVNFVWNFCNETSIRSAHRNRGNRKVHWIREFDLNGLLSGSSTLLGLHSQTIQSISKEFVKCRDKRKIPKLRWRSRKRSLGWIPFKRSAIKISGNTFTFQKRKFKFWKSREIKGKLKTGCFKQDAKGNWFVCFTCEIPKQTPLKNKDSIGIDLGLKDFATMSDGTRIENPRHFRLLEEKLAKAQRAKKKKQVTNIHAKIRNARKDFLHKQSTAIVRRYKKIFVGDVNSKQLTKTRMAKSVLDAGWGMFRTMLAYKAEWLGVDFRIINESYSTVTCSDCSARSGPSGLSGLSVRNWVCSECGSQHDRDINAAQNILNFALGH